MFDSRSRTYRNRRWIVAPPDDDAARALASQLRTSPLVGQVLLNRGLTEIDACRDFLAPTLRLLHEPERIPGMAKAAERIARAIRDRQRIVIYGDYDVDGITATAILWHAIRRLGGTCDYYVPHRIDEGYGLNSAAIEQICAGGAQLVVTVDCGVTAVDPCALAAARGLDVIVTDHHDFRFSGHDAHLEPGTSSLLLPDVHAIVHPRISQEHPYPNPHLCGAGVAFKLAWAVGKAVTGQPRVSEDFRAFLIDSLALAALGTIADVVPLIGENRVLARFGLGSVKQSKMIGLRALIESANLTGEKIDSYHVGFLLAPRLNAAGRMGHAQLAVEMLTHADEARAGEIASYLESQNRARQQAERQILDQALEQAAHLRLDTDEHSAIVLGATGWHAGVIGIVASRVVDRFHKPTIMVSLSEDNGRIGQGSGRSISGFHLARALEACDETLVAHGGHEMAAGLKVKSERFEDFRAAFLAHAKRTLASEALVPRLPLEGEAALRDITPALASDLQRLGPFGQGNRRPVLCCRDVELAGPPKPCGKDAQHLQLYLRQNGTHLRAIAFRAADLLDRLKPGIKFDLAVEPCLNEWNGQRYVELEVKDIQFA
jgi:single-stranded-DNA-specific exonuclease